MALVKFGGSASTSQAAQDASIAAAQATADALRATDFASAAPKGDGDTLTVTRSDGSTRDVDLSWVREDPDGKTYFIQRTDNDASEPTAGEITATGLGAANDGDGALVWLDNGTQVALNRIAGAWVQHVNAAASTNLDTMPLYDASGDGTTPIAGTTVAIRAVRDSSNNVRLQATQSTGGSNIV